MNKTKTPLPLPYYTICLVQPSLFLKSWEVVVSTPPPFILTSSVVLHLLRSGWWQVVR
ncbi:hypothetical protein Hanom_Chr08g00716301 [Helianthus anomalus]